MRQLSAPDDHVGNPENPETNAGEADSAAGTHLPTPY